MDSAMVVRLVGAGAGILTGAAMTMATPTDAQLHQDGRKSSGAFSRTGALGASIGGGVILGIVGIPAAISVSEGLGEGMMSFGAGAVVGGILGGLTASVLDSRNAVKQLNK
ncbi:MAG: hypothetical protein H7123_04350 [Thermoleophilia bacterium]|nr:hypothetical protein [Thermoleophilia bacterium]